MDWLRESEEKIWRLKRHVIWIKEGDQNTNFFHNYAKHMKNINSIWEIKIGDGTTMRSFKEKYHEAIRYFSSLFQESVGCPIQDILEVIANFPHVFSK